MSNPRSFYSKKTDISTPGAISGDPYSGLVKAYKNLATAEFEGHTVTLPATPDAEAVYSIIVDGVVVEFTTDDTPTTDELRTGLFNAFRTNPEARSLMAIALGTNADELILSATKYNQSRTVTVTGTGATAALSTPIVIPPSIPFGVFVARESGMALDAAKLPSAATDVILGVTKSHLNQDRNVIGESGITDYRPQEVMDVLERCNSLDGIWVRAIESDITVDDTVYVSFDAASQGYVTKTATNAIDISSLATFVSETFAISRDNIGTYMVLVRFNKP